MNERNVTLGVQQKHSHVTDFSILRPGRQLHPDEVALGVAADGALGGGGGRGDHPAAVEAGPLDLHLGAE